MNAHKATHFRLVAVHFTALSGGGFEKFCTKFLYYARRKKIIAKRIFYFFCLML